MADPDTDKKADPDPGKKTRIQNTAPVNCDGDFRPLKYEFTRKVYVCVGSVFRIFEDPDQYSECGSGFKFNVFGSTTLVILHPSYRVE